jgi:WD40 repeat protein
MAQLDSSIRVEGGVIGSALITGSGNHVTIVYGSEFLRNTTPLGANPYQGLDAFDETSAQFFFGRERLVKSLVERFTLLCAPTIQQTEMRLLAIVGPSGCGKSSIARAGLIPAIATGQGDWFRGAKIVVMRPGASPIRALADAIARLVTGEPNPIEKRAAFEVALRNGGPLGPCDGLSRIARENLGGVSLVVLVDQFEETYTLSRPREPSSGGNDFKAERDLFVATLLEAASQRASSVSVLLTMRSDYLGALAEHAPLSGAVAKSHEIVPAMSRDDLRRAVAQPASVAGHPIDPSTIERILDQSAGEVSALPLVEFTLERIWERMRDGVSPADTLTALEGIGGALASRAGEAFERQKNDGQKLARKAFLATVQVGDAAARDTRVRAWLDEVLPADGNESELRDILDAFVQARLLAVGASDDGRIWFELPHEALIRNWQLLRGWIDTQREDLRFTRRLQQAAENWDASRRARGLLWRRPDLDLLRRFAERNAGSLTDLQLSFFAASERQQSIEWWLVRAAVAALVILAAVAIQFGVESRQYAEQANHQVDLKNAALAKAAAATADAKDQASKAQASEKDAIAQKNVALNGRGRLFAAVASQYNEKGDYGTALSVALAGISEAQKPGSLVPSQLQLELFVAQNELRERATFQGLPTPYYNSAPALSPDGKLLAACAQHALVVWDVGSKVIVGKVPDALDDAGICNAAFSPDGKTVVFSEHVKTSSAATLFRIRAFDTTLTSTKFDIANDNDALAIAFTPNGKYLVAYERERTYFLDPSSGQTLWSTPGETPPGSGIWRDEYEMSKPGTLSSDSKLMIRVVGARVDIWDIAAKQKVNSLDSMVPITTVAISPDHARIITASFDGVARVWDIDARREVFGLGGHTAGIISVAYSPDGSLILTCSKDGTARLWDAESGTPIATLRGRRSPSAAVISGSFTTDGRFAVTLNSEGDITFWDASPAMASADWADADIEAYASLDRDERAIPVSVPYKPVLTEPTWPRHMAIAMVDVRTGKKIATAPFVISKSDNIAVSGMQVCRRDNRVLIDLGPRWQVRDATLANVDAEAKKERYRKVLFSPDCKSIVTSVWNQDTDLFSVIRIVSSTDGSDVVHRAIDKDQDEGETISSLEFSSNGKSIVVGIGESIVILDPNDLKERKRSTEQGGEILFAIPSPDGRFVVAASERRGAFIWNTETDTYTDLGVRKADPKIGRFSQDGKRLVTGFADGVALVWDTDNLEQIARVRVPYVSDAMFTDDARHLLLVTGSGVRMTRLYSLDELVAHAKSVSVRNLDATDQAQIFSLVPKKPE